MKALLVDDEGLTREGLALLIQMVDPGVEVTPVGTLEQAARALEQGSFDFVFLDVRLDDESGLDFLERLKDQGVATPVIMLSAQDDRQTVMDAIARGAFGFLPKQTENPGAIRQAMEVVLRGGVYLPATARGRGGDPLPQSGGGRSGKAAVVLTEVTAADLHLSPRLYETLYYVAQGLTNKAIARRMSISDNVVAEYVKNAFMKLNVSNRAEFMVMLNRRGHQLAAPPGFGAG